MREYASRYQGRRHTGKRGWLRDRISMIDHDPSHRPLSPERHREHSRPNALHKVVIQRTEQRYPLLVWDSHLRRHFPT